MPPKTKRGKRDKMHKTMSEYKEGELYSGSGHKVTDRKQAIAIGLKQSGQSKYGKRSRKRGLKRSHK